MGKSCQVSWRRIFLKHRLAAGACWACLASTTRALRALLKTQCLFCFRGDLVFASVSALPCHRLWEFSSSPQLFEAFQILGNSPFCWSLDLISGFLYTAGWGLELLRLSVARSPLASWLAYSHLQDQLLLSYPRTVWCSLSDICRWPVWQLRTLDWFHSWAGKVNSAALARSRGCTEGAGCPLCLCSLSQALEKKRVTSVLAALYLVGQAWGKLHACRMAGCAASSLVYLLCLLGREQIVVVQGREAGSSGHDVSRTRSRRLRKNRPLVSYISIPLGKTIWCE